MLIRKVKKLLKYTKNAKKKIVALHLLKGEVIHIIPWQSIKLTKEGILVYIVFGDDFIIPYKNINKVSFENWW